MIEQDTIKLLRECDSGVKMGISAIDEVIDHVKSDRLRTILKDSRSESRRIETDLKNVLNEYHDSGKDPAPVAKGMSWLKTNMKIQMNECDSTVSELMIDGCNMGIKSLSRYLNQYVSADERSKDLAKRLVNNEERLSYDMREFL